MALLTVKVFLFDFKNAGRRDIVTEKNEITEEQGTREYESKLEEKLSSDIEEAWPDIDF